MSPETQDTTELQARITELEARVRLLEWHVANMRWSAPKKKRLLNKEIQPWLTR